MTFNKLHISCIMGVFLVACLIGPLINNDLLPPSCMERQWKFFYLSWMIFVPILFFGIACVGEEIKKRLPLFLTAGLLLGGAYEMIEGIRQLSGASLSAHRLFAVTGTFYNPAPFCGYLAIVFPLLFFFLLKRKSASLPLVVLLWIATGGLLAMMLVGMSRSAWVATIASACYVWMSYRNPLPGLIASFRANLKRNTVLAVACLILLVILFVCLYFFKENSAIGRLLIWKISLYAILKAPLIGYGHQSFECIYGDAQEDYFSVVPRHATEVWVADTPEFAFNEYLQLAMERGVPMLCLAIGVLVWSLRAWHRSGQYGLAGSIIAIAVFACSSYPLHIPGLLSATLLLIIAGWVIALPRKRLIYIGALLACTSSYYCYRAYKTTARHEKTLYLWYDGHKDYMQRNYEEALQKYSPLYDDLRWNANYLLELGRCLQQSGRYYESLHILLMAETRKPHVVILEMIGVNYQNIGCIEKAEEYFLRSSHRIPSRITPYYLLACLYAHPDNYHPQKAIQMAQEVISRKPKVDSELARNIKREAQELIEQLNQTNNPNESENKIN